jgi:hypothetical protein
VTSREELSRALIWSDRLAATADNRAIPSTAARVSSGVSRRASAMTWNDVDNVLPSSSSRAPVDPSMTSWRLNGTLVRASGIVSSDSSPLPPGTTSR